MDGKSGVQILFHATSAGYFAMLSVQPESCKLFSFNPNVVQNFFSIWVDSVVYIPLGFAASQNGFTRLQFFPFLDQPMASSKDELHHCVPCYTSYETI